LREGALPSNIYLFKCLRWWMVTNELNDGLAMDGLSSCVPFGFWCRGKNCEMNARTLDRMWIHLLM
jgi:hypothetical protein